MTWYFHGGWFMPSSFAILAGQPAHKTAQDLHLSFGELCAHGSADLHAGRHREDMPPPSCGARPALWVPSSPSFIPQAVRARGFARAKTCVIAEVATTILISGCASRIFFAAARLLSRCSVCTSISTRSMSSVSHIQDGSLCSAGDRQSKLIPVLVLNIAFKQARTSFWSSTIITRIISALIGQGDFQNKYRQEMYGYCTPCFSIRRRGGARRLPLSPPWVVRRCS